MTSEIVRLKAAFASFESIRLKIKEVQHALYHADHEAAERHELQEQLNVLQKQLDSAFLKFKSSWKRFAGAFAKAKEEKVVTCLRWDSLFSL